MKYTLLDLTQLILSSMDSDEVNSIDDTVESQQVAKVIQTVYYDIVNRANIPQNYTFFQLDASADSSKPVLMTIPSGYQNVNKVKYNKATVDFPQLTMEDVCPLPLEDFLTRMYQYNTTEDNIETFEHTIGTSTVTFVYRNDFAPAYYTAFDDNTIIFDSYDADVDTTLQKSKTLAWGKKNIQFLMIDSYEPELDDKQFALLINEAKSLAFQEAKQTQHPLADRNARRDWVNVQKNKTKIPLQTDLDKLPNFGRR